MLPRGIMIIRNRLHERLAPSRMVSRFPRRNMSFDRHSAETASVDVGSKNMSMAFVTGVVAGGLGGLIGLGGGFIALPMLTGPMGLTNHLAHGTSIAAVLGVAIGGATAYSRNDNTRAISEEKISNFDANQSSDRQSYIDQFVDWLHSLDGGQVNIPVAAGVALSASIFAILGARLSTRLSADTLRIWRGWMQICFAPTILIKDHLKARNIGNNDVNGSGGNEVEKGIEKGSEGDADLNKFAFAKSLAIGSFSGIQAGVFGVGGGAIVVPCLCIIMNLDYKVALGTSLASMLPTAATSGIMHYLQGTMLTRLALPLGAGCLIGSYCSGSLAPFVNEQYLKYGFTGLIFSLGVRSLVFVKKVVK